MPHNILDEGACYLSSTSIRAPQSEWSSLLLSQSTYFWQLTLENPRVGSSLFVSKASLKDGMTSEIAMVVPLGYFIVLNVGRKARSLVSVVNSSKHKDMSNDMARILWPELTLALLKPINKSIGASPRCSVVVRSFYKFVYYDAPHNHIVVSAGKTSEWKTFFLMSPTYLYKYSLFCHFIMDPLLTTFWIPLFHGYSCLWLEDLPIKFLP